MSDLFAEIPDGDAPIPALGVCSDADLLRLMVEHGCYPEEWNNGTCFTVPVWESDGVMYDEVTKGVSECGSKLNAVRHALFEAIAMSVKLRGGIAKP